MIFGGLPFGAASFAAGLFASTRPVVPPASHANEWYGYLRSYAHLSKRKRQHIADDEPEPEIAAQLPAVLQALPNRPLLAVRLLETLRNKALKEGADASQRFIEGLLTQQRYAARLQAESDDDDAICLLCL